jgi:hypothetical protein
VVVPLVFQHGPAETVFTVTVVVWAAFEFVMRVRQRFLSRGPATVDRGLPPRWACGRIRRPGEPTVSVR